MCSGSLCLSYGALSTQEPWCGQWDEPEGSWTGLSGDGEGRRSLEEKKKALDGRKECCVYEVVEEENEI